jgi:hypothetical protein
MNIKLSGADRKQLAARLMADIDAACIAHFDEGPRDHLGASEIGETCARRLTYSFRWMHRENLSGQMHRLFKRGHFEESRFQLMLELIGAKLHKPESGKQWRIEGKGLYGGSLDERLSLPPAYGELPPEFLGEYKTHNQRSFDKLKKDGVKLSKPKHFAQMSVYGEAFGFDYAIYMAVNKNTDELYIEVVELDHTLGRQLAQKAAHIIAAVHLPPKIAASDAYSDCKFCPMAGICHRGEPVNVNCRSCKHSAPQPDKTWRCNHWNAIIPHDAIRAACPQWEAFA